MYYTVTDNTGTTYPGLWGLWPVTSNAASAVVGNPSSYGGDFQDAWDISTGAGVVVAVVDSGITPNIDIVGSSQKVAAGSGSNLISVGYDFISDCRVRGVTSTGGCAASTTTTTTRTPTPDATDTGDYITSADVSANASLFPAVADSTWHGTIVSGIIAALGNNNFGVIGGAYNAKILPVRVLGKGGGSEADVAEGIKWAAGVHSIANPYPARVINLSLGGAGSCSSTMQGAIDAAVAAGAVVVVAAGNDGVDAMNATPANCNNVISVVAIGRNGSRASYSNYGTTTAVTLAAPGGDDKGVAGVIDRAYDPGIWSTANAGTITQVNTAGHAAFAGAYGTSMAAPHVSAAAALLLSKNASLSPAQVKTILSTPASMTAFPSFVSGSYQSTNNLDCVSSNNCGAGILNAKLAVQNSYVLAADVVPVDFGSVTSGGTVTKTVIWTNVTAGTVSVTGSASITGTNSSFFTIESSSCDSTIIAPTATCTVTMKYAPTSSGSHSAVLVVHSATLTSGVSLVGTLTAPAPSGGGGGGGCAIMPFGANPDFSLLLAMLAVGAYWLRRRMVRTRGAA
jgi:serine protease